MGKEEKTSKVWFTDFRCKPDEGPGDKLKRLIMWLSSPGAAFMVGQVVAPDGGYSTK